MQALESLVPVMTETYLREGRFYEEHYADRFFGYPSAIIYYPVLAPNYSDMIVGSVSMELVRPGFLSAVFPPRSDMIDLVVENSCGQNFTYKVDLKSNFFGFGR